MIKAVLIINKVGTLRLFRFYEEEISIQCRKQLILVLAEVIQQRISSLSRKACNFIDRLQLERIAKMYTKSEPFTTNGKALQSFSRLLCGSSIVYRTYATLHFIMLVDDGENLLGLLDRKYVNVCEYDLIFDPQSGYKVLDEMIVGGLATGINLHELTKDIFGAENQEAAYQGTKIESKIQ